MPMVGPRRSASNGWLGMERRATATASSHRSRAASSSPWTCQSHTGGKVLFLRDTCSKEAGSRGAWCSACLAVLTCRTGTNR